VPESIQVTSVIERKHPALPRFVLVSSKALAQWGLKETTVVEGTLNNIEIGRRTIKRGDEQRWFIDLPESLCRKARVDTGDSVTLLLRVASDHLPEELARRLASDAAAKDAWDRLTPSRQRMVCEDVAAAKQPATRERRAARALAWHCGQPTEE
jgi:hypothetical protein